MTIKQGTSKKKLLVLLEKLKEKSSKGIDIEKYTGKVKFKKDALLLQKELRNEWD